MKFFRVLAKLEQPHLCTDRKIFARLAAFAADNALDTRLARIKIRHGVPRSDRGYLAPGRPHATDPDDIAFVQYSSGSTSEPKGVALTHRNLLTNIAAIAQGIELTETDVGLSWMPLTHDMGLIGFHLTPFVFNVTHHLISTATFRKTPAVMARPGQRQAGHRAVLAEFRFTGIS